MTTKISVIILTYNQENFIARAIEGVFMQKISAPVELIISNDNSTDRTDEVIRSLIKSAPENIGVKYFHHKENKGATPNFFWSLMQVSGKYLAFCEGDDYWTDPHKLQIQLDFMEKHPDYAMCFHQVKNSSPDSGINNTLFSVVENRDYTMLEIYRHWIVHTTSVFMRADILANPAAKTLVKHPELLYFDTFLYMSCGLNGKIRGSDKTMSSYMRHEAGISNGTDHRRDLRHNHLDEVIGQTFGGKVRESSNWQIFSRSRMAFVNCLRKGNIVLALQHLKWIMKKKGNLKVYLMKKYGK